MQIAQHSPRSERVCAASATISGSETMRPRRNGERSEVASSDRSYDVEGNSVGNANAEKEENGGAEWYRAARRAHDWRWTGGVGTHLPSCGDKVE